MNYEHQLKIKKNQVEEAFWKIGKNSSPPVLEPIAASKIYHYRGKAQYHAKNTANGWQIGFWDVSGGRLVNIEHCEIMEETINEKTNILRENKQLRNIQDDQLTIWSDFFTDQANKKESIVRVVKGKNFLVPRDGFFQANLYLTDQLVDEVCRFAAIGEVDTVVDAYSGSGLFSVFLSPFAKNIVGIEVNEKSVKYARINARNSGLQNVKFICGDVGDVLQKKTITSDEKISLIILDPPRSGCEEKVLKAIVDLQPLKIIYVSCNPATQARDAKYLNLYGYNLLSLLPIDMFPQTEHIEVIGVMERL
ncbi:rna methyltransferase, trma family [hydrocarbon metagenome]|uniref:Rna methyltransferase, trma family n=1 Tax=hydrocarbon metagenome TaxID=938273 RepID=A0A0W8FUB1_9ZZZZ